MVTLLEGLIIAAILVFLMWLLWEMWIKPTFYGPPAVTPFPGFPKSGTVKITGAKKPNAVAYFAEWVPDGQETQERDTTQTYTLHVKSYTASKGFADLAYGTLKFKLELPPEEKGSIVDVLNGQSLPGTPIWGGVTGSDGLITIEVEIKERKGEVIPDSIGKLNATLIDTKAKAPVHDTNKLILITQ